MRILASLGEVEFMGGRVNHKASILLIDMFCQVKRRSTIRQCSDEKNDLFSTIGDLQLHDDPRNREFASSS